ncbi:hypothetical protein Dsin_003975 [Dipteronia sinensis]|uniref:Uncharacterized protein n=1 Tax=Dipteronia sinensis TaxID=43782 RepID=A0AAE0B9Y0_9ROSI|nr:hypothetical protein Dsin_003975 [Dipteronia sinensis]
MRPVDLIRSGTLFQKQKQKVRLWSMEKETSLMLTEGVEDDMLSPDKLQRLLGWSYRSLEETLIDSIECYWKMGILN